MKEEIRRDLVKKLKNFKLDCWVDDVEMMLQLVFNDHTSDCTHEYALRSINPKTGKLECMCLDCGQTISQQNCQKVFDIGKKYYYYMDSIRLRYFELLYSYNSEYAITNLSEECGIELSPAKCERQHR